MPARRYSPKRAWRLAGLYFASCGLIAVASGALRWVISEPWVHPDQSTQPGWWALSLACTGVILIGYGLIWPRGSFTDGRQRQALVVLIYGLLWGLAQGLLFLSIVMLVARSGWAPLWVGGASYLVIGSYMGLWHRFFWDIYVSPPHNYTEWNLRKVLLCHTPNLVLCLSHLMLFGNAALFLLWQTLALLLSAWAMRFPGWRSNYTAIAGQERTWPV